MSLSDVQAARGHEALRTCPTRLLVLSLVVAVQVVAGCEIGSTNSDHGSARTLTGRIEGASYVIDVPASWNGVLLLYSHGGGALVASPPAEDAIDAGTASYFMRQGYALAGSSFRSSGWFVEDAIADDIALLGEFRRLVGHPTRTIAWGASLGGMVTLGLAERPQTSIDGALPLCGVVADAVPFWNQNLDAAFAFKVLFAQDDPQIQVTGGDPSTTAGEHARSLLQTATTTRIGRARTALVAALREIPVQGFRGAAGPGGTPLPVPTGLDAEDLRAGSLAGLLADALSNYFVNHPAMQQRAGGNPSSNDGVDYGKLLASSPDFGLVRDLYGAAGSSIEDDLARLRQAPRISAGPAAVAYVNRFVTFTGRPQVPVITLHTVADESTPAQLEEEYGAKVRRTGGPDRLRQLFVSRGAHCNFTTAEIAVALEVLLARIRTGKWGEADNLPALNAMSARIDARYWVPIRTTLVGGPTPHSYPSFVRFESIGLLRNAAQQVPKSSSTQPTLTPLINSQRPVETSATRAGIEATTVIAAG